MLIFSTFSSYSFQADSTLSIDNDIIRQEINENSSDLDTVVVFSAQDTIKFNFKEKILRLRGDSKIDYKTQSINAEVIEIYLNSSNMDSYGLQDSSGNYYGFPVFNDSGEEFAGERIKYDFKSGKGAISLGETEMEEGFYFGDKIKRVTPEIYYIQDGRYTTCDPPYYYFGSDEMKVITGDKIFLDPLIMYVEDMPIFMIPFGLFFEINKGKRSGLIVPEFFFSANRGVVIENLGYYYKGTDNWDTKLLASYFTKGGYLLENQTRWKKTNKFEGDIRLAYGRTRFNTDSPWVDAYTFMLNHNQEFNPLTRLNVDLDFKSQNFNRQTSTNLNDIVEQNVTSRASLNRNFDNGTALSVGYQRDQNIINDEYIQNANVAFSVPNFKPLRNFKFLPKWTQLSTFRYNFRAIQNNFKDLETETIYGGTDSSFVDSSFAFSFQRRIEHRPSFTINPKLGYFTISPFFNFSLNNYFRRINRRFNSETSELEEEIENGFYAEYSWNTGVSANTFLYGIIDNSKPFLGFIKPSWLGFNAFRHTYNPQLSFTFTPDQSQGDEFYGSYTNEFGNEIQYSRFALDGGGIASRNLSSSISYSDNHNFEIKVKKDSVEDENLLLLNAGFRGSYNFAADSLNFSNISMNFRNDQLKFLSMSGSANFSLYDQDRIVNQSSDNETISYNNVNRFLIDAGKGLARLTNFSINFTTSLNSKGFSSVRDFPEERQDTTDKVEPGLGDRFSRRMNMRRPEPEHFGDEEPGYEKIAIPWDIRFNLNYSLNQPNIDPESRFESLIINSTFNFSLTPTWRFSASGGYDISNKEFNRTRVGIIKDLSCWRLSIDWFPTGFNRGFLLNFGITSAQLKDLKIEKRSTRLYR